MKKSGFQIKPRKPLKRTPFKRATVGSLGTAKSIVAPRKRKHKSDLKKLKEQLWKLCR